MRVRSERRVEILTVVLRPAWVMVQKTPPSLEWRRVTGPAVSICLKNPSSLSTAGPCFAARSSFIGPGSRPTRQ